MTLRQKDKNRAELVQAIIRQNGGRIFTVVAKRKEPKRSVVVGRIFQELPEIASHLKEGDKFYLDTKKNQAIFAAIQAVTCCESTQTTEHFMELTCRTGVKSQLKGGESTIKHKPDLISVNLTNGKGYRCFSAYNVLELRAGGTVIKFKEQDVLDYTAE